jgi:regulator of RNase E activity RraA
LTGKDLEELARYDTPTICNALSAMEPDGGRRQVTSEALYCPFPERGSMVGYARTAAVRSAHPSGQSESDARQVWAQYWHYLQDGPLPSISIVQDLDGERAGFGAFWGEINSNVHRRLGCVGTVTDGSIRDLDAIPPGFQMLARKAVPSDGFVRIVEFGGAVRVAGLEIRPGDLIHADRHGAVVVPPHCAQGLAATAAKIVRAERKIIDLCRSPQFSLEALSLAWSQMGDLG